MTVTEFAVAMERRGCAGNGKTFCGTYDGYPFTATYMAGNRSNTSWSLYISVAGADKAFVKAYKARTKGVIKGYVPQVMAGDGVTLSVNAREADIEQKFDATLKAMVETAKELHLGVHQTCPLCGAPGCDSLAYVKGSYRPAHATCVQNMAMTSHQKAEDNAQNGSYLLGFVGSLLGAVVGALPTLITIYFFNSIYFLLCALIPLGAYQGYKLLKGRRNKLATVFTILASLLSVPAVHYILRLVQQYEYNRQRLSVAEYITHFTATPAAFLLECGPMLLGVAIGIFFAWGAISRTSQAEVYDAAFSANTMRPLQPPSGTPQ